MSRCMLKRDGHRCALWRGHDGSCEFPSRPVPRRFVAAGSPCTCGAGRYVRFVVPKAPGMESSVIACRANDAARGELKYHPIPAGTAVAIRVPSLVNIDEVIS